MIPASCVLHRRSCFEKYGYWPEHAPLTAVAAPISRIAGSRPIAGWRKQAEGKARDRQKVLEAQGLRRW